MTHPASDLTGLIASFRTLSEHPPVPSEQLTYLTGQVCRAIARVTGTRVTVTRTELGCQVRFVGNDVRTAVMMLRRQMGSVTGQIIADTTDMVLVELGKTPGG